MDKKIPIFFTFNNNYAVPAAVAFYSLLNKAHKDVFYEMYVLHSDITEKSKKLILNSIKNFNNFRLEFKNAEGFLNDEWEKGNFSNNVGAFTSDTLLRCFAAKFFPQYDKIIYSDVDCVFMEDISELFEINLDNEYIAAVKDIFLKYDKNELSHLKKEHYKMLKDSYFAGGIWVLNLKKIRKDNLEQKMLEILKDDTIIKRWNDMDIMNIACENKVKFIPLNYISYPYLQKHLSSPDFISHYSRDELYDSLINPKIIHYAYQKPWNSDVQYKEIWYSIFHYLNLPKTSIFKDIDNSNKKLERKIKKYKTLYNTFLIVSITALICLIFLVYHLIKIT